MTALLLVDRGWLGTVSFMVAGIVAETALTIFCFKFSAFAMAGSFFLKSGVACTWSFLEAKLSSYCPYWSEVALFILISLTGDWKAVLMAGTGETFMREFFMLPSNTFVDWV